MQSKPLTARESRINNRPSAKNCPRRKTNRPGPLGFDVNGKVFMDGGGKNRRFDVKGVSCSAVCLLSPAMAPSEKLLGSRRWRREGHNGISNALIVSHFHFTSDQWLTF